MVHSSDLSTPLHPPSGALVLVATTWVQALCSAAMLLVPTVAPHVAASLGVSTGLVGLQVSLLYAFAMVVSIQAGVVVRRGGACRASQHAMALVTIGCLFAMLSTPATLMAGTVFLGVSYGLTNPAAAHLLTRFTSPHSRNMVFSIKQTGVPIGGALAGMTAPPIAQGWGWQAAFLVLAVAALVTALALQVVRERWDDDCDPRASFRGFGGLRVLRSQPPIRWLGFTGFCLAAAQLSLLTFLVAFLVEELLIGLLTAGLVMSAVHLSGVCGRVGWGMLADLAGGSLRVLFGLATAMVMLFACTALLHPGSPFWLAILLFLAAGSTAIGWNGVYLAAVASRNTPENVGEATGAVLVLTYMGVLIGPALFTLSLALTGSYAISFLLPAGFAGLGLVCLLMCGRATRAS